jgi:Tfp pilus assembly protein PilF
VARAAGNRPEAVAEAAKGDKALRAFDTAGALQAFQGALRIDPSLASAHRGMGMVYVLQGKDAEAKAEYRKYLQLQPDAPDREQIERLLSR